MRDGEPRPDASADLAPATLVRIGTALFLAGFGTFTLIYCTQPLLPEFAAEFGVDPATSSLALSLTTGLLAFSILVSGAASEVLGRRGLMFASICGGAALNVLASLAPSWAALLLARALEGLVLGGVPAVAMAYLAEEIPARRIGTAMGVYVGGTAFGGMMGRVAMGALTEVFSWRLALGVMGVVGFVAAIAFVLLLPPSRNFVRRPGLDPRPHLRAWTVHLRHTELPLIFVAGFLAMGAFVTVYNYAGFRLVLPPYGLDQTGLGLIFLSYTFGIVASPVAGLLADRFGRPALVIAGTLVAVFGLAMTTAEPLPLVIAGIVVVTIGFFTVHAVASGWVGRLAHENKSHAASLYLLSYYLGSSVLGSLGGWFWHVGGWAAVIAYCAVLMLGVLAIGIRLRAKQRTRREARLRALSTAPDA